MRLPFALYFILIFECLYAQEDTLIFYPVINNSLQQRNIRSITIDEKGKLWLSTSKGIACYDGNNVQIFTTDYGFFKAFRNQENNLYTIQSQGIYFFDTKTGADLYLNTTIKPEASQPDPRTYTDIYSDKDKSFWYGRTNGFFHFDMITKKTMFYPLYTGLNKRPLAVRNIIGDLKNPDLILLATDDGIYKFDKKSNRINRDFKCTNKSDSVASDVFISKMYTDSTGNIWFTGKRGVGFYDIQKGLYNIYPAKEREIDLKFLQPKDADEFYVGSSESCPGIFNTQTHQYIFNTKTYKQFPALSVNDFVADRMGNMWCVIFGQLYYASANKNKFHTITLKDLDNNSQTKDIFKTVIWDYKRKCFYSVFDNSNYILVLDSSLKITNSIPINAPPNEVKPSSEIKTYDISLDSKGRLWACGTYVTVYDSSSKSMIPANKLYGKLTFRDQRFQNIISRGDYLYLQPSNPFYKAIYRIDINSFTYDSIPIPYDIIPEGYENSWNGGTYQEVAVIDKRGKYAYIGIKNYILQVNLLTKKGKKITRVTLRDNGYYSNMYWYVLDDDSNLWISSGDGIRVIDPDSLRVTKRIHHDDVTQHFQLYNADGLGVVCLLYSGGVMLYDYRNSKEYSLSLADGLITFFNSGIACVNNTLFVGAELNALQYIQLNTVMQKNSERRCYLSGIQLFNEPYVTDTLPEYKHLLQLPHNKNFLTLTFSCTEYEKPEQLEYRYRLEGIDNNWISTDYLNRTISYRDLKPGNYVFYTSIKNADGSWNDNRINLHINIIPAWWQTDLFKIACSIVLIIFAVTGVRWRVKIIRRQEQQKAIQAQEKSRIEKELLELEAKALRAQMNPHFIFNCMNSIKALIQKGEQEKAIIYLTTFSKLIRTIFQNSDKKEITLHDEIETCRLYMQLESMRFGNKLNYEFCINQVLDLKSVMIPALIIQPFIENAIWHGIMPKENGGTVMVNIDKTDHSVYCTIDDNGIGRATSKQNRFKNNNLVHESKGEHLTQARLDLDNLLNGRDASIEIIDKKDENEKPSGTTVILRFYEY